MGSITVKVSKTNTNKCEVLACGSNMYERFKTKDVPSSLLSVRDITSSTRIVCDKFMKPDTFIGMDSESNWIFWCL
ncbi:hypothetical protein NVP1022O_13 [Vibrio phage 1.022.O._10N.286.45.A10]|nr:hypothetical protein NVP1022O_13 [Vibrio phage 1.022.O._10N.286.45.A10]